MLPKYTAALEALDTKAGRVHTIEDCQRIGRKLQHAPGTITDDELVILGAFHGEASAVNARTLRTKALTPSQPDPPAVISTTAQAPKVDEPTAPTIPPETPAEFLQRVGVAPVGTEGVTYDSHQFAEAHHRYLDDPKTMTVDDIKQFAIVDAELGTLARAKQLGFVEAEDTQFAKQNVTFKDFNAWHRDYLTPTLATYRYRARQAVKEIEELKSRVLELEAQHAAREAVTHGVDR